MARKEKSNLARTGKANTTNQVAEFAHHLIAHLLKGKLTWNEDQRFGDVWNPDLRLGIESKASDNGHPWRISLEQLERHADPPFPADRIVYALFGYRGRGRLKNGERRPPSIRRKGAHPVISLLARKRTKLGKFRFLARRVDTVYLLDTAVVQALSKTHTVRVGGHAARPRVRHLFLGRRDLCSLRYSLGARRMCREIGLDRRSFYHARTDVLVTVTIDDNVFTAEFTLITLLRRSIHRKLLPIIVEWTRTLENGPSQQFA